MMLVWKRWSGPAADMPPLHWRPTNEKDDYGSREVDRMYTKKGRARKTVAILSCRHGHNCALVVGEETRFSVTADGVISPSVQCPVLVDGGRCDGHEGPPTQLGDYRAES